MNRVIGSQQVSWYECHLFMQRLLAQANYSPLLWAGTPSWCALADGDPRKLLALAQSGVHHALRVETAQDDRCAASRAVSAAADWPAVGREIAQRNSFYAERPWLRRVAS